MRLGSYGDVSDGCKICLWWSPGPIESLLDPGQALRGGLHHFERNGWGREITLGWAPSALQLADGLTTEALEAGDTLGSVPWSGWHQPFFEDGALRQSAQEKQ